MSEHDKHTVENTEAESQQENSSETTVEDTTKQKHWLYRQENLPKLWIFQAVILILAVLPEFFITHKEHLPGTGFTLDTTFGFFAWYGFLTCTAMVVCAKALGFIIKRKDTYYDE